MMLPQGRKQGKGSVIIKYTRFKNTNILVSFIENEKYILMAICQLIILLSTKVSALPLVKPWIQ